MKAVSLSGIVDYEIFINENAATPQGSLKLPLLDQHRKKILLINLIKPSALYIEENLSILKKKKYGSTKISYCKLS